MTQAENLGPAERILQSALGHVDHAYHGRPGVVTQYAYHPVGYHWAPVTHKVENGEKVVYRLDKAGRKTRKTRLGVLGEDFKVRENGNVVGEYRQPGLFPEVVVWLYRQVAEVWKLDNEFAARWASYAYRQEYRDLKAILAAFMLVQNRKGDPVVEGGEVLFNDEDYRDVGEAMVLSHFKDVDFKPALLLRMYDILRLPGVAEVNRELGFANSARNPFLGRLPKVIEKWLRYREENLSVLEGLVKAGWRRTVMELARRVHYKPENPKFFDVLSWKQVQAKDGRRSILIGQTVTAAVKWDGLTEKQICERIVLEKPSFKRLVGVLPKEVGITRAVVAAALEAGSLSDKDILIYSPTLEELGLLDVPEVKKRWESAIKAAEDMRASNIAKRLKNKDNQEKLEEASDNALKKAVEEAQKNIRVYVLVDISGSMSEPIKLVKEFLPKLLPAFTVERTHVATFHTIGKVVEIKHPSKKGVDNAFRGISAGGGTLHRSGVRVLSQFKPKDDEDSLLIVVGDEGESGSFAAEVRSSGLRPMAIGLFKVGGWYGGRIVQDTAAELGIPCFNLDTSMFEDVYAVPRTIRNLVASTPVGQTVTRAAPRFTLVEQVLKTDLLAKPAWA